MSACSPKGEGSATVVSSAQLDEEDVGRVRAPMRGPGVQRYCCATFAVGVLHSRERQLPPIEGDAPRRAPALTDTIFDAHPPFQHRHLGAQSIQLRRDHRVDDERSSLAAYAQQA